MSPTEYRDFLKDLRYSYELKLPDLEISDFWFEKIRHIPAEALNWIRDQIVRQNERFPKRFDSLALSLWREWLHVNPDKCAGGDDCPECDNGFVTVMELEPKLYGDVPITVAYACGKCRANMRGIQKLTKSEARARGMGLVDAKQPFAQQTPENLNVRQAAKELGNRWAA